MKKDLSKFKEEPTMIMAKGRFQLNKWHNSIRNLEEKDYGKEINKNDTTYAKLRFGTKASKANILGILWHKSKD